MKIEGWNEFYDGWLARVLLQPVDANGSNEWKDGWKMADETGDCAIYVLQAEIRLGHIRVSSNNSVSGSPLAASTEDSMVGQGGNK